MFIQNSPGCFLVSNEEVAYTLFWSEVRGFPFSRSIPSDCRSETGAEAEAFFVLQRHNGTCRYFVRGREGKGRAGSSGSNFKQVPAPLFRRQPSGQGLMCNPFSQRAGTRFHARPCPQSLPREGRAGNTWEEDGTASGDPRSPGLSEVSFEGGCEWAGGGPPASLALPRTSERCGVGGFRPAGRGTSRHARAPTDTVLWCCCCGWLRFYALRRVEGLGDKLLPPHARPLFVSSKDGKALPNQSWGGGGRERKIRVVFRVWGLKGGLGKKKRRGMNNERRGWCPSKSPHNVLKSFKQAKGKKEGDAGPLKRPNKQAETCVVNFSPNLVTTFFASHGRLRGKKADKRG
ncbi:hypothetical protein L345_07416, partial [Ophiophagus hannah]